MAVDKMDLKINNSLIAIVQMYTLQNSINESE